MINEYFLGRLELMWIRYWRAGERRGPAPSHEDAVRWVREEGLYRLMFLEYLASTLRPAHHQVPAHIAKWRAQLDTLFPGRAVDATDFAEREKMAKMHMFRLGEEGEV